MKSDFSAFENNQINLIQSASMDSIHDKEYLDNLYVNLASHVIQARHAVLRSIDTEMVKAYWLMGRDIVTEEQKGEARAGYGKALLKILSVRLTKDFGRGFF